MPTVKTIDNIKIDIYSRDHPPPHFHAKTIKNFFWIFSIF
jgi:hypothetical protein